MGVVVKSMGVVDGCRSMGVVDGCSRVVDRRPAYLSLCLAKGSLLEIVEVEEVMRRVSNTEEI